MIAFSQSSCGPAPATHDKFLAMLPQIRHQANCIRVDRLDKFDPVAQEWQDILVEDRHAGPAEVAASRIDTASWLRSLPTRNRRIARVLAKGETTKATAKLFDISPARVSQLRREFHESWRAMHGELATA